MHGRESGVGRAVCAHKRDGVGLGRQVGAGDEEACAAATADAGVDADVVGVVAAGGVDSDEVAQLLIDGGVAVVVGEVAPKGGIRAGDVVIAVFVEAGVAVVVDTEADFGGVVVDVELVALGEVSGVDTLYPEVDDSGLTDVKRNAGVGVRDGGVVVVEVEPSLTLRVCSVFAGVAVVVDAVVALVGGGSLLGAVLALVTVVVDVGVDRDLGDAALDGLGTVPPVQYAEADSTDGDEQRDREPPTQETQHNIAPHPQDLTTFHLHSTAVGRHHVNA